MRNWELLTPIRGKFCKSTPTRKDSPEIKWKLWLTKMAGRSGASFGIFTCGSWWILDTNKTRKHVCTKIIFDLATTPPQFSGQTSKAWCWWNHDSELCEQSYSFDQLRSTSWNSYWHQLQVWVTNQSLLCAETEIESFSCDCNVTLNVLLLL